MKRVISRWLLGAILICVASVEAPWPQVSAARAQESSKALPALASGETLKFKLLWPSGVAMGEAIMTAAAGQNDLHFEMKIEAKLPVYNIAGSFTSSASREGLCSIQYHRKMTEGAKVSEESIDFDQKNHQARRILDGQAASLPIPQCARDPLTFLYYYRNQVAAGIPADIGTFFLGPERSIEIKPARQENISVKGSQRSAGKYLVTYRVRNSAKTFELWISSDARREPVMVRLPSSLAIFSAELE